MNYLLDSHTHTLASGHAYSTLLENARAASERGLALLCITDHAPGMPCTTHKYYFQNMKVVDRRLFGVEILMGAELNLMDFQGGVDLEPALLRRLDMAIVSMHRQCMPVTGDCQANTQALIAAMDNPFVSVIGHPDDGKYPLDYPALVRAAGERGVLLEVNNSSLTPGCYRDNAPANCAAMLQICRKEGVPVVVGSDAHFISAVGAHQYAEELFQALDFPRELVVNADPERFCAMVRARRAQAG